MGENTGRTEYNYNNPRLRVFMERFRKVVDNAGGISNAVELTGISRPTILFWYNGERTPDAVNLKKLSEKFGVSSDYLLGLTNEDNSTNDEKLRMISEHTGLGNDAVIMLDRVSSVAYGKKTVNTLISNPLFYRVTSYLSTFFFGGFVEEFTGEEEGLVSEIRLIKDPKFLKQYVQPAMLSKITEMLVEIKKQVEEEGGNNGKH